MITWMTAAAFAGSVYVNGVNVDTLRGQTFENVTVTIDSKGDILITAPQYRIEVQGQTTTTSTSVTAPPVTTAGSITGASTATTTTTSAAVTPPPAAAGLGTGRYWLVTEDNGSAGHSIDVFVNDRLVQQVRSGGGQMIVDLSQYMHTGANAVRISSNSASAAGGTLYVYIGAGSNQSGTVVLDKPDVQYGLGASRSGAYSRDYTITVP